jgi:putative thioredoxin
MNKYVIDVGDSDFEIEVLAYSQNAPVVVDFWAEWCGPCKMLSPILEKLANEADGAFRLAKVDVDANPNLSATYQIQSIPAVKAFNKGQVVGEFMGVQTEAQIREFLRKLAPGPGDLALDKAHSLLAGEDWQKAAQIFGKVLKARPDNSYALLGLAKSYIAQGEASKALAILNAFPASSEYKSAEQLKPLALALSEEVDKSADDDNEAAYQQSLRLVRIGNVPAAIDGLLDLLRGSREFRDGQLRELIVAALHLLGEENALTRDYRNELSSLLF